MMSANSTEPLLDEMALECQYLYNRANYLAWEEKPERLVEESEIYKKILERRAGAKFVGPGIFVSPKALVYTDRLIIGAYSFIAAGAIVRGDVEIGSECSLNCYSQIAGTVKIGTGVRIANQVSIFGFNHGYKDTDTPIRRQPNTSEGITIGDDIWIGSNAVIVDGVHVGSHSVIAGGAVVTKNVPEYSIVGGNPAVLIKDRRS